MNVVGVVDFVLCVSDRRESANSSGPTKFEVQVMAHH